MSPVGFLTGGPHVTQWSRTVRYSFAFSQDGSPDHKSPARRQTPGLQTEGWLTNACPKSPFWEGIASRDNVEMVV